MGLITGSLVRSGSGGECADWYQPFPEHCAHVQAQRYGGSGAGPSGTILLFERE